MRNKNFHLLRTVTIDICTEKDDQEKIERVIHEITKAKLSCLQEVHYLNNNLVTITNKQNNVEQKYELYWSIHVAKGSLSLVSPLKHIKVLR